MLKYGRLPFTIGVGLLTSGLWLAPGSARAAAQPSAQSQSPSATSAEQQPFFCTHRGPIPASALANGISADLCNIVGRSVLSGGIGVQVPKAGYVAGGVADGEHGSIQLRVANLHGTVTVSTASSVAEPTGTKEKDENSPNGVSPFYVGPCHDPTYKTEFGGADWGVNATVRWWYNRASTPYWLSTNRVLKNIRQANANITRGQTNCGRISGNPRVSGAYQGNIKWRANMHMKNGSIVCQNAGGRSVVDWGGMPKHLVAYTCWWTHLNTSFKEADVRLGKGGGEHLVPRSYSAGTSGGIGWPC